MPLLKAVVICPIIRVWYNLEKMNPVTLTVKWKCRRNIKLSGQILIKVPDRFNPPWTRSLFRQFYRSVDFRADTTSFRKTSTVLLALLLPLLSYNRVI